MVSRALPWLQQRGRTLIAPVHPCFGRFALTRSDEPLLDGASLPTDLDLFRVGNFATMFIGTARFMEAVRRLELDGIAFRELPALSGLWGGNAVSHPGPVAR